MLEFNVEINNGVVDSYWFEICKSGIKHLLINTTNRWVQYDRLNNNLFWITDGYEGEDFELKIPELTMDLSGHICTALQEKDQINFYWTPRELLK